MEENRKEEMRILKDRIMHPNATSLIIKRLPKNIADAFKKYANDEFVGDYGMALKSLVDQMLIEPQKYAMIIEALQEHENRISALEQKPQKEIKTLSGKIIRG